MKTATIPSLRVDPQLRQAAEDVLREGETLSSFVEESVRTSITRRKLQAEFIARGLAVRDEARRTGVYHTVAYVKKMINRKLTRTKAKSQRTA